MTKITHDQINQMTLEQLRALLLDPLATTSAAGLVELATDLETQTGTDTGRVVTPASLHKKQGKTYLAQYFQRLGTETHVFSLLSLGSGVVLAGTGETGKIFKSTDSGATWTEIQRLGTEGRAFSLVSLGSGVALAGTYPSGKIFKSTDSGATWTEIQRLGSETYAYSLASLGSGVVLAGTASTGSVFRLQEVTISW